MNTDERAARADLCDRLRSLGLLGPDATPPMQPLRGGVSSDIWKVDLDGGPVCVKRALARLRVAADWRAPVERNAYEVAWYRQAARVVPGAVPQVLAHSAEHGLFVMQYLEPAAYPLWKAELLAGHVQPGFAARVGDVLGRIHAATAGRDAVAAQFPTDTIFHHIRLAPYLEATAERHPAAAASLHALVERTATTRLALVHGDVSPKNILCGPGGPVLLDAECAWYGDPAFDAAFCANHLLLKMLVVPGSRAALASAFDAFTAAWAAQVAWEPAAAALARMATLLPALALARVDGKSPVEYLSDAAGQWVREVTLPLIGAGPQHPDQVLQAWRAALDSGPAGGGR